MKHDYLVSHHETLSNGIEVAIREGHKIKEYTLKNGTIIILEAQVWLASQFNHLALKTAKTHLNRLRLAAHESLEEEMQKRYALGTLGIEDESADYLVDSYDNRAYDLKKATSKVILAETESWFNSLDKTEKSKVKAQFDRLKPTNHNWIDLPVRHRLLENEEQHQAWDKQWRKEEAIESSQDFKRLCESLENWNRRATISDVMLLMLEDWLKNGAQMATESEHVIIEYAKKLRFIPMERQNRNYRRKQAKISPKVLQKRIDAIRDAGLIIPAKTDLNTKQAEIRGVEAIANYLKDYPRTQDKQLLTALQDNFGLPITA